MTINQVEASLMNTIENAGNLDATNQIDEEGKAIMEEETTKSDTPKQETETRILKRFPTYHNDSSSHYNDLFKKGVNPPKSNTLQLQKSDKPFDWLGNSDDHNQSSKYRSASQSSSLSQVLQSHLDDDDTTNGGGGGGNYCSTDPTTCSSSSSNNNNNSKSLSETNNFIKKLKTLGGSLLSPYYYVLDTLLIILIIFLIAVIILSYILPPSMMQPFNPVLGVTPLALSSTFLALLLIPLWTNEGYQRLLRILSKYNQIEQVNFLRKIQGSSVMLISSFIVLFGVMAHFEDVPKYGQCGARIFGGNGNGNGGSEKLPGGCSSWILATAIPNLLIWSMITGSVQIVLTHIFHILKAKFQEEAFHSKLIKNRFNVFLIDKLSLFVGIREEELRKRKGKEMRKSHRMTRIIGGGPSNVSLSNMSIRSGSAGGGGGRNSSIHSSHPYNLSSRPTMLKRFKKAMDFSLSTLSKGPWLLGDVTYSVLGRLLNWPREAFNHSLSISPDDIERNVAGGGGGGGTTTTNIPFLSLGNGIGGRESLLDGMSKELTLSLKEETAHLRSSNPSKEDDHSLEEKMQQEDLLIDSCQTNQDCLVETDEEALCLSANRGKKDYATAASSSSAAAAAGTAVNAAVNGTTTTPTTTTTKDEAPIVISEDSILAAGPRSSLVAKLRARKLWRTVAIGKALDLKPSSRRIGKDSITLQDLQDFFHDKDGHYSRGIISGGGCDTGSEQEQAQVSQLSSFLTQAFRVLDLDGNGEISREECRNALLSLYEESRNLQESLANRGSALHTLEETSKGCIWTGLAILLLGFLGAPVSILLGFSVTLMVSLNFMFFDLANKTINSFVFLFIIHPYDIGDSIVLRNDANFDEEEILIVKHINIQTTLFQKWNGIEVRYLNHVISTSPITNLTRSKEQWEKIDFKLRIPAVSSSNDLVLRSDLDRQVAALTLAKSSIGSFLASYPMDYIVGGGGDGANSAASFDLKARIPSESGKGESDLEMLHMKLMVRCKRTSDVQRKWLRHARLVTFVRAMAAA